MLKEIEEIRRALLSLNALDEEAKDALATLEAAVEEIDRHPDSGRVREVVTATAGALSNTGDEAAGGGLAETWAELKDQFDHWEEDHPSIVLAIGRVSNSLAAFGL